MIGPDDTVLAACRVEDCFRPVPGSIIKQCAECGHDVVVSPNSLRQVEAEACEFKIVCQECLPGVLPADSDLRPPKGAVLEEIEKMIGKKLGSDEVAKLMSTFSRDLRERRARRNADKG